MQIPSPEPRIEPHRGCADRNSRRLADPGSAADTPLTNRPGPNSAIASPSIGLAGASQIPFLVQLRQFSQMLLHFLPSLYPLARGLLRALGNIVAGGLALLPAVAHIQMRTMLGSISLAMAARLSAGAVSFR